MARRLIALWAILVLAAVACPAFAVDWSPTTMLAVGTTGTLVVSPSCAPVGTDFAYSYDLTNATESDYITGFTLVFPASVPVAAFTALVSPDGWIGTPRTLGNKINWRLGADSAFSLSPGATKTFGFTSSLGPSFVKNVFASSQDSYGWSGQTFGPAVPEPAAFAGLAMGLLGLASGRIRRR